MPHVRACLKIATKRTGRTNAEVVAANDGYWGHWTPRATPETPFPPGTPTE